MAENKETFENLMAELDSILEEKAEEETEPIVPELVEKADNVGGDEDDDAVDEAGDAAEGAEEAEEASDEEADDDKDEDEEAAAEKDDSEDVEEKVEGEEVEEKDAEDIEEKVIGANAENVEEQIEVEVEPDDEEVVKEEVEDEDEVKGGKRVVMVPMEVDDDDEDEDEKAPSPVPGAEEKDSGLMDRRRALMAQLAEVNEQLNAQNYEVDEDEEMERKKRRHARLVAMGWKEEDLDSISDDAILCAVERKMLPNDEPCAFCVGGCAREGKALPGLLDIEAEAMASFKGEILESGYAPNDDLYVVDIKAEDGRTIEAFYTGDGTNAGWILLNQDIVDESNIEGKDALAGRKVISVEEAQEIATKSIEGVVVGAEASLFEGYDAWAIQVEGIDGKSYDAYVGLDGTMLGFDEFDLGEFKSDLTEDEVAEIKAIEAELHFKREFSASKREELAKEGHALPDGSFPIMNAEDLNNAIQAFGRAKNQALAKAHIMKRAAQLGLEGSLPEDWTSKSAEGDGNLLHSLMEFEELQAELDSEDS